MQLPVEVLNCVTLLHKLYS